MADETDPFASYLQDPFAGYLDMSAKKKNVGPLSNVEGEGLEKSAMKGLGTAGILAVADQPGMAGNLSEMVNYLGHRIAAPFRDQDREEATAAAQENVMRQKEAQAKLLEKAQEGMRSPSVWDKIGAMQLANAGATMRLPTGEDIAHPIFEKTGEYKPEGGIGQTGMAAARAGLGMIGPGGWTRGIKAATEAQPLMTVGKEALKGGTKAIPLGAIAGTVGDVTTQVTGEPIAGMITGSVAPIVAPKLIPGGNLFDTTFRAKKDSQTAQRLADQKLIDLATNPEKALADAAFQPSELISGAPRTLAEVTGDTGLAHGQKAAETANPAFREGMDIQRGEQNKARVESLKGMAPEGADAMTPTRVIEENVNRIQSNLEAEVARLTKEAQDKAANVPAGMTPESIGQQLRSQIASAEAAADAAVSQIYQSIGQEGLRIVGSPVREAAETISSAVRKAKNQRQLSGEEADIFAKAAKTEDVESFADLVDLEKRITNEVRRNQKSPEGDPATISRLGKLKTAIREAMDNAVKHQDAYEQTLVERGQMTAEDTLAARLKREAEQIQASMEGRSLPPEQKPAAPVEGPNMTQEALDTLAQGKRAHAEQAQTYGQGPVGSILENTGFSSQYKIPDSGIPRIAFSAGDKGYTNVQAFLKAAKNDPLAVAALEDAAVMRLRERMGKSDTLDPKALDAWKKQHANALRALDEVSPGFSAQFDDAASATTALQKGQSRVAEFQSNMKKAPAAKFLGLTDPSKVADVVGGLLTEDPSKLNSVMSAVSKDPAALGGLRSAGVEYMVRNFLNNAIQGGERVLSGNKLSNFLDRNSAALETLYGKDGMKNMQLIAADLRSAEEAATSMRSKFGSDTAANIFPAIKEAASKIPGAGFSTVLWYEMLVDGLAAGNFGRAALAATTEAGKHLLSAMHSRGINNINQLVYEGLSDPKVGRAMLQRGLDAQGRLKAENVEALTRALIAGGTAAPANVEGQREQTERLKKIREGRATGGAVNLMALSKAAKKQVTQVTEPLLNESDDTVAHALEIANKHI